VTLPRFSGPASPSVDRAQPRPHSVPARNPGESKSAVTNPPKIATPFLPITCAPIT
jgi:hypothetical protein